MSSDDLRYVLDCNCTVLVLCDAVIDGLWVLEYTIVSYMRQLCFLPSIYDTHPSIYLPGRLFPIRACASSTHSPSDISQRALRISSDGS